MLPLSSMPPISLLPPFMVCGDGDRGFRLVFVGIKHCSAKRNESGSGERALPYQIHPLLSSWLVNPSFSADIVVDVSAYDSLLLDLGVSNELGCRLECRWLLEEWWVCLNEHLRRCMCCYATVYKEVRFGLTCILTDRQRVESKAMLPLELR
ncbi:hypothetical protein Tco_1095659 [Tanacetum coccineum]